MRLKDYLNEQKMQLVTTDYDEKINIIKRDCKYYLKLLKGKKPMVRGMKADIIDNNDMTKKQVRQDRRPKGMSTRTANAFNKWLEENGHVRRDRSVFLTSGIDFIKSMHGEPYYIFPIGKFNYTWVKAKDVNLTDGFTGWDAVYVEAYFRDDFNRDLIDGLDDFPKFFFTNTGFDTAYNEKYEIWMDCKEYYFIKLGDQIIQRWNEWGK